MIGYGPIAQRYARAIFELGDESGQLDQLNEQISKVAEVYAGSKELSSVLENPMVDEGKRDAILKDVAARLGLAEPATNALRLLAQRKRLRALPEIARRLGKLSDEKAGVVRAVVTSAGPLSEAFYRQLQAQLEKQTSRKILFEKRQDPALLAGVVTRIGGSTFDGSLKGRLEDLERRLLTA